MADIAAVESKSEATTLPTEQVREAARQIKNSLRGIFSSWPEYQNPRLLEQETVKEFTRSQGQAGEGLWEITEYGPYIECHLTNSKGEWNITVQSNDQDPRTTPVISTQRMRKEVNREIPDSPPKNSQEALNLALEFVKEINGGQIPPELVKLGG